MYNTYLGYIPPQGSIPDISFPSYFALRDDNIVGVFTKLGGGAKCSWPFFMTRNYVSGEPIQATVMWTSETAQNGYCIWDAIMERHEIGVDNATPNLPDATRGSGEVVAPTGSLYYTDIVISGDKLNGLMPGEHCRFLLSRPHFSTSPDTMAGNAHLFGVYLNSTISASGNTLGVFFPFDKIQPGTTGLVPTIDLIESQQLVLNFSPTVNEFADFIGLMPPTYGGGSGIQANIIWSPAASSANRATFGIGIEVNPTGFSMYNNNETSTPALGSGAANAGTNVFSNIQISLNSSQIQNLQPLSQYRLRLGRLPTLGSDTFASDAEFHCIELVEV